MAEVRILQDGGKDIIPVTHEDAVLDSNGVKISDKYAKKEALTNYATKKEVNELKALLDELVAEGVEVANDITDNL